MALDLIRRQEVKAGYLGRFAARTTVHNGGNLSVNHNVQATLPRTS